MHVNSLSNLRALAWERTDKRAGRAGFWHVAMPAWAATLLVTLVLTAGHAMAAEPENSVVNPSATVSWTEMLEFQARNPDYGEGASVVPYMPAPPAAEIGPNGTIAPPAAENPESAPADVQVPRAPSPVTGFQALPDNNVVVPPDTMGAAGPNHLMVMLNSQVRIQNKIGTAASTVSLATFWTAMTGLSGSPFDPRVMYDRINSRWIAVVDANGQSTTSAVWLAVSSGSDPTGSWTFYAIDADSTNSTWADFPNVGINSKWVAITNNMFTVSGNNFVGVKMWVLEQSTLGSTLAQHTFATGFDSAGGSTSFTLSPALTYSAAESNMYIIDGNQYTSGGTPLLRLSRITGTASSPSWSAVPGSVFSGTGLFFVPTPYELSFPDAGQLGTASLIRTNDPRVQMAVFRNGHLWTTFHAGLPFSTSVNNADRTAVFWYELNPAQMGSTGDPIVQSGVIDGGSGIFHYFPSIAANASNDAAVGFTRSSVSLYAQTAATARSSGDAAGTMDPISVLKMGEDSYIKDFGSGIRWGDYSATSVDPADDTSFWTIQEYAAMDVGPSASNDRWGTWWGKLAAGAIFSDGFESGDTSAWSLSVP